MKKFVLIALGTAVLLSCGKSEVVYVSAKAGGEGNGTADSPYPSLSKALEEIPNGGKIFLTAGDYTITETIIISKSVSISGGYSDDFSKVVGRSKLYSENSSSIEISSVSNVELEGVEFSGGGGLTVDGGFNVKIKNCSFKRITTNRLFNIISSEVEFSNVVFEMNSSDSGLADRSKIVFKDVFFRRNDFPNYAVQTLNSLALVKDSLFEGNQNRSFYPLIHSSGKSNSSIVVNDSAFVKNEVGAIILATGSDVVLSNCIFASNKTADMEYGYKGAVAESRTTMFYKHEFTIDDCIFIHNESGGLKVSDISKLGNHINFTCRSSHFEGNYSPRSLVYINAVPFTISNCTFTSNYGMNTGVVSGFAWNGGKIVDSVFLDNNPKSGTVINFGVADRKVEVKNCRIVPFTKKSIFVEKVEM